MRQPGTRYNGARPAGGPGILPVGRAADAPGGGTMGRPTHDAVGRYDGARPAVELRMPAGVGWGGAAKDAAAPGSRLVTELRRL